jgi:hypothetical protein
MSNGGAQIAVSAVTLPMTGPRRTIQATIHRTARALSGVVPCERL